MARYVIQFTSAALNDEDEVFNRWYDDVHMPDVLKLPGFLTGQRYTVIDPASNRQRYMAAYEVECDDPMELLGKLMESGKDMEISPALDMTQMSVTVLKPGISRQKKT